MSTVIPDVTARLTSWLQSLLGEDVRVEGLVGYGIMESLIGGVWPELGLTAESDHKVSYN
ncbi:hypothetical protein BOH72_21295 [Mycobacterium sp. WY10]|nr:hypothetical protein BOH72_21295 [Mycobacterium sp. WY10]